MKRNDFKMKNYQEEPIAMNSIKWEKEIPDDEYGLYKTGNANLYNYLIDCGIVPLSWAYETKFGKQKKVWTYRSTLTLKYYVDSFRKEQDN